MHQSLIYIHISKYSIYWEKMKNYWAVQSLDYSNNWNRKQQPCWCIGICLLVEFLQRPHSVGEKWKVGSFLLNSPTPSSSVPSAAGDSPLSPSKGVQQVSSLFFLSALHTPEDVICKSLQVESGPRGLYPSDRSDVQPLCSVVSQAVVGNCWSMWPGEQPPACFQLCLYQPDLDVAEGAGGHAGNCGVGSVHCRMSLLQQINYGIIHTDTVLQGGWWWIETLI